MTRRAPVQGGLWGRSAALGQAGRTRRYTATNDVELVVSVIRSGLEPGYVVLGAVQRVYLRDTSRGGCVVSVPRYEADTVAQLLDQGHLTLGGTHHVSDGHHEGAARAVLVTASARALADRWAARPLPRPRDSR